MPETFVVTKAKPGGEKPNPHGGTLFKWYVSLRDEHGKEYHDVYWQRKSQQLSEGEEFYGHIEQGEYGPRFKTDQRPDGNFKRPDNLKPPVPDPQAERSRRIERQHSQEMAIRAVAFLHAPIDPASPDVDWKSEIAHWTDHFQQDLDADVGGDAAVPHDQATADVSIEDKPGLMARMGAEEASPPQKRKLTQLFNKAGIAREAQKAIVLYRCRSEKATKDGASQLIQDLTEGATHDSLVAEVHDAARSGDPLAIRAAKLIPTDMPWEDDGSLPEAPVKDEADVPF